MRVLQVPLDPSGGDTIHPPALPKPVAVEEGPDGLPVAVWRQRVASIEGHRAFDLWWLPASVSRAYYQVNRKDRRQVALFHDQHEYQQVC